MQIVTGEEYDLMSAVLSTMAEATNQTASLATLYFMMEPVLVLTTLDLYSVLRKMVTAGALQYCAALGVYYLHPTRQKALASYFQRGVF